MILGGCPLRLLLNPALKLGDLRQGHHRPGPRLCQEGRQEGNAELSGTHQPALAGGEAGEVVFKDLHDPPLLVQVRQRQDDCRKVSLRHLVDTSSRPCP